MAEAGTSSVLKDGHYFRAEMDKAIAKLNALCEEYDPDRLRRDDKAEISEEAEGRIRAATGKAQLLVHKRFPQFRDLCQQNLDQKSGAERKEGERDTLNSDLEGFWDLILLAVEDVYKMFTDLATLRSANWQIAQPERKATSKPKSRSASGEVRASSAQTAADEARRKAIAAKRNAFKQSAAQQQQQSEDLGVTIAVSPSPKASA
eukprot:m.131774 g.131774  ORF g.131774 m.131774 type:complete len:205 (-) comp16470_c0_seq2:1728-2342(-)